MEPKRLTITYGGMKLYDEIPEDFEWHEGAGRIHIEAGAPATNPTTNAISQAVQKALANGNAGRRAGKNGATKSVPQP